MADTHLPGDPHPGVDLQQSAEDRAAYISHIAGVPVEYLVFIGQNTSRQARTWHMDN
ncbi:hypothetical protein CROQUDRAFT_94142 [Cronartium quercuum f. sp. fusiforme G11]|uniref:Uncharacterized protein n=1 Tax=Cronartium quercuum f. sp. fusiforme G11 TaxID=708437 RepID=A0A9P6NE88_9BASI|nr:hypothetical protein CROQUDRAFT_94142 [Cronartium quercuum f. sp. fusiforme G11]